MIRLFYFLCDFSTFDLKAFKVALGSQEGDPVPAEPATHSSDFGWLKFKIK
ncbi:MAG: hypothetical protein JWM21_3726 [Acidobacteria bacterium]|nr:hypothetical protein [Acidobacteriota bacterium]